VLTFGHRSVEEALENGVPKDVGPIPSGCLWVVQEQGPPVVLQITAEPRDFENLQEESAPPATEDANLQTHTHHGSTLAATRSTRLTILRGWSQPPVQL